MLEGLLARARISRAREIRGERWRRRAEESGSGRHGRVAGVRAGECPISDGEASKCGSVSTLEICQDGQVTTRGGKFQARPASLLYERVKQ